MNEQHIWLSVAIIALITSGLRFLPFWVFNANHPLPGIIQKLGKRLPSAIMGMLVVYCLKDLNFSSPPLWFPALASTFVVTVSYIWKRNTLLSIIAGTLCHMLLSQAGIFI